MLCFNAFRVQYVSCFTQGSPDEEAPHGPGEDEEDTQEPALRDEEGDGQHDGVGVVLDHDEELRHRDGRHQPRLLAQLLVELPVGGP